MNFTDWIGFLGVFQILLAYVLNVSGKATNKSFIFIILNLTGATMACMASVLLNYWPFIILEGIWALVSLYSLITYLRSH
ncbi:CBU_0592 family membrane protein [Yeosuana sp.]|uniref:CBU_0592 family membrane protein n=1 Tax=Yeosuana sp. TaxID=2529388 RepID=UPI004054C6F6